MDSDKSVFLNERFMAAVCVFAAAFGIPLYFLFRMENDVFSRFEVLIKLLTAISLYFSFRHYNWDVAKGLIGGVLFCIMYQEAYLVLAKLWQEEDFDKYLVAGVQGSIYLAAAGMSFLMTFIIMINHFIINYAKHGNPENVILNHMAIVFKFGVYVVLLVSNSMLSFAPFELWKNALSCLCDMAILLLIVCIESQIDSFKVLRKELLSGMKETGDPA